MDVDAVIGPAGYHLLPPCHPEGVEVVKRRVLDADDAPL